MLYLLLWTHITHDHCSYSLLSKNLCSVFIFFLCFDEWKVVRDSVQVIVGGSVCWSPVAQSPKIIILKPYYLSQFLAH